MCCSKHCSNVLKQTTYLGKNNPRFGLKGHLSSSFKGEEIHRKNNKLQEVFVYAPNRPDCDKHGRVRKHRLLVLDNYKLFNPCFFT